MEWDLGVFGEIHRAKIHINLISMATYLPWAMILMSKWVFLHSCFDGISHMFTSPIPSISNEETDSQIKSEFYISVATVRIGIWEPHDIWRNWTQYGAELVASSSGSRIASFFFSHEKITLLPMVNLRKEMNRLRTDESIVDLWPLLDKYLNSPTWYRRNFSSDLHCQFGLLEGNSR